MNMMAYST